MSRVALCGNPEVHTQSSALRLKPWPKADISFVMLHYPDKQPTLRNLFSPREPLMLSCLICSDNQGTATCIGCVPMILVITECRKRSYSALQQPTSAALDARRAAFSLLNFWLVADGV